MTCIQLKTFGACNVLQNKLDAYHGTTPFLLKTFSNRLGIEDTGSGSYDSGIFSHPCLIYITSAAQMNFHLKQDMLWRQAVQLEVTLVTAVVCMFVTNTSRNLSSKHQ